jgi:transposase InsO family protein
VPWSEKSIMSQRHEFVMLFEQEGVNRRELCRRFGISPTVGYRLWARYRQEGHAGLADRSRRPQRSPGRSAAAMEALVVAVRAEHPAWGGRKIRRRLQDLKHPAVPSASTITAILHRQGRIAAAAEARHKPFERFERAAPNELWQMDYKGHFATRAGRCHPLTVVDDHSRYAVGLRACGDERGGTVQAALTAIFRQYGLPERMLMDNGSPWGSDALHRHTWLTVWLLELGVGVSHGRPYHPQTQGKSLPSAGWGRAVSSYPDGRGDRPARLYRSWRVPAPV